MTIYSNMLFRGNFPVGVSGVLYTAPTGMTVVIRELTVFCNAAVAAQFNVFVPTVATIISIQTTAAVQYGQWTGRQVLVPGDTLKVSVGGAAFDAYMSGYVLQ